jgi:hypothetical protein
MIELVRTFDTSYSGPSLSVVEFCCFDQGHLSALFALLINAQRDGYDQLHMRRSDNSIAAQKGETKSSCLAPPSMDDMINAISKHLVTASNEVADRVRVYYTGGYASWTVEYISDGIAFQLVEVNGELRFYDDCDYMEQCVASVCREGLPTTRNPHSFVDKLLDLIQKELNSFSDDDKLSQAATYYKVDSEVGIAKVLKKLVEQSRLRMNRKAFKYMVEKYGLI